MDVCLDPNQSENEKYNMISGWFNKIWKIFFCVYKQNRKLALKDDQFKLIIAIIVNWHVSRWHFGEDYRSFIRQNKYWNVSIYHDYDDQFKGDVFKTVFHGAQNSILKIKPNVY